jgi:hypothetical protein
MRRLLVACALFALFIPVVAAGATGDGTLVVRNAKGSVGIAARGGVIGHCDFCRVVIDDPQPDDGTGPVVTGFEGRQDLTDTKSRWAGSDLRFRLIGGFFRIKVAGSGIDLSAVGHGSVTLKGDPDLASDGTYSLNGDEFHSLPDLARTFQLAGAETG